MGFARALVASTQYEALPSSGIGVQATSGSGAYGSLATIGTTGFNYDGFVLSVMGGNTGRVRLTITVNTGSADENLIQDFYLDFSAGGTTAAANLWFPVAVPAGAVLKVKIWHSTASDTAWFAIVGFQGDARMVRGFGAALTGTDFGATQDPTNQVTLSGTTTSAWAVSAASTPARFAGVLCAIDWRGGSVTANRIKWDIGYGASSAEHAVASWYGEYNGATYSYSPALPCDIPAGSRLVYRGTCGAADTNTPSMVIVGLAA